MSELVQVRQSGTGEWLTLDDTTVTTHGDRRHVSIPAASAFASRLTAAGLRRYLVTIGEPGQPDTWHGLIHTWAHNDQRLIIDVRPAATIEDLQG